MSFSFLFSCHFRYKFSAFLFLISFICFSSFSFTSNKDSIVVEGEYNLLIDQIEIFGNEITEAEVIYRELPFQVGDTINNDLAFFTRERIYSLALFNHVDVFPVKRNSENSVIIKVEESWYIYPIPFVYLKDRDWDKIVYGINLEIKNFRGRNELLEFITSFGFDPAFKLKYISPWLFRNDDLILQFETGYISTQNRSTIAKTIYGNDFDHKIIFSFLTIVKRFGLFTRIHLGLGFDYVSTEKFVPKILASNTRIDRTPIISLGASYDTRDLAQFPSAGIYAFLDYKHKGFGVNGIDYNIISFDFRRYQMLIDNISAKLRFTTRQTFGNFVPFYDRSFLGFDERIRGYFTKELEGNHYYLSSLEFRYPIIKELRIETDLPIIPKSLQSVRFALYAQIFGDTGTALFSNKELSFKRLNSGYGIGLTFLILPYNAARIEAALDEFGNLEWILDLGISF